MPAMIVGLLSAIGAAVIAALAGHGLAMVALAYVLGGICGMLLGAWRHVIASECKASSDKVNRTFIVEKDKSIKTVRRGEF